jgi:hypothetical protein
MPERDAAPALPPGAGGQFFLEIAALIGFGRLGWTLGDGGIRGGVLATVIVVAASAVWGTFRAPGFVPNGREPVVAIPGPARLALEVGFFMIAAGGLWVSGWEIAGASLLVSTILLYAIVMRERTRGLLRNAPPA